MTAAPERHTCVGDISAAEWRRAERSFARQGRRIDTALLALAPDVGRASIREPTGATVVP